MGGSEIDGALRADEIFRMTHLQIIQGHLRAAQSERGTQRIERNPAKLHSLTVQRQSPMRFRGERVEFPFRRKRPSEIARRRAEKLCEAIEVWDEGVQLPTEGQPRPIARLLRPRQFAVDGQFVTALSYVELIDF